MIYLQIIGFILGLFIGSFIDVIRLRGSWKKSLFGRSMCFNCNRQLNVMELIPLVSFLAFKGKCRKCNSKIHWSNFVSELLMGAFFLIAFSSESLLTAILIILTAIFLIPIFLQDIETFEIPEHFSYPFAVLTFLYAFYLSLTLGNISHLLYGLIAAAPFYLLWKLSKGRLMGLGDAKLFLALGFLLMNFIEITSAIVFSFWIGTIFFLFYYLLLFLLGKKNIYKKGAEVPFAPFIIVAFYIVFLTDYNIFNLIDIFRLPI